MWEYLVKTGVKVYHHREKCLSLRRNDTTWQLWEGLSLLDGSMFYFISLYCQPNRCGIPGSCRTWWREKNIHAEKFQPDYDR